MVEIVLGDLFTEKDSVFVQCISADLAMGAGIALEFNKRFNTKNRIKAKINSVDFNSTYLINTNDVICLVTKDKYYQKPTYERMRVCLERLLKSCLDKGIKKLAMPAIGCGLDGLNFVEVHYIIQEIFHDKEITVKIYLGKSETEEQPTKEKSVVVCGTGHRPASLPKEFGYNYNNPAWTKVKNKVKNILKELKPKYVITGMALGFDQVLAIATIELIKDGFATELVAAIPCKNQSSKWTKESQELYNKIFKKCKGYKIISEQYTNTCMNDRNKWMVDHSDIIIAMFNGNPGGTKNCLEYAKTKNKRIINILEEK